MGFVAALRFELCGIGIGLIDISRLHGEEDLLGRTAVGLFDF